MDVEKFLKFIEPNLRRTSNDLQTPQQIDDATDYLMRVVQQGIQESTPFARPSEWSQPEWTPDCTEAIKETRRAFRRCKREDATEDDWAEYKELKNKKGKRINKALRNGFRGWVRRIVDDGPRGLWKVSK